MTREAPYVDRLQSAVLQTAKRALLEEIEDLRFAADHHRDDDVLETIQRTIVTMCMIEKFRGGTTAAELKDMFARCVDVAFRQHAEGVR